MIPPTTCTSSGAGACRCRLVRQHPNPDLDDGDLFGEIGLLRQLPRTARTVITELAATPRGEAG